MHNQEIARDEYTHHLQGLTRLQERNLDQTLLAYLAQNGFAVVKSLVPQAAIEQLRSAICTGLHDLAHELAACGEIDADDIARASSFQSGMAFLLDRGTCVPVACVLGDKPRQPIADALTKLRLHPAVTEMAKKVLGEPIQGSPQYALRAHCPHRTDVCFPWHQDVFFLDLEDKAAARILNFWIPLVTIDMDAGGLEVVAQSHKLGLCEHVREPARGPAPSYTGIAATAFLDRPIVVPLLEPGDALLMFDKTIHRSRMNYSQQVRWSIDIRYLSAVQPTGRPHQIALAID